VSAEESLVISNDAYYYFEVLHMEGNAYQQEIPVLKLPFVYSYNMRNNKIPNVDNLRHWELPMIYDIDFSINLIDRLPPINLPSLVILRISNNRITNIDALKQSDLSGLELLDISHNLIEGELPVVKLRSLKTLNLEHNRISSIINLGDCRLPNLVTLKLSHNSIARLHAHSLHVKNQDR
jgi:Leucine-rich repeat (LRR) protein